MGEADKAAPDPIAGYLRQLTHGLAPGVVNVEPGAASNPALRRRAWDIRDVATPLGDAAMLEAKVYDVVVRGYTATADPPAPPGIGEHVGAPPGERTTAAVCHSLAEDPTLKQIDAELRTLAMEPGGDLNERVRKYYREQELRRTGIREITDRYGVAAEAITFIDSPQAATFLYKGNFVRLTSLPDVTEVVSWSDQLSPVERDTAWADHEALIKQTVPVAYLDHHVQHDAVPSHLEHITERLKAERDDIGAAYNASIAQIRNHSIATGFRQFRVHSSSLRLAIPVTLHILEQPPAETYPIIGDYSETNGSISVRRPGLFGPWPGFESPWKVDDDGMIARR